MVRAEVVLTHGLGEHAARYDHVAAHFGARGLRLWSYDLRGHGRSSGRRGDVGNYRLLVSDLAQVTAEAAQGSRPVFLLGHSMGAQIVLQHLLLEKSRGVIRGAVAASPWLRLAFAPKRWRLALGRLAMRLYPSFTQPRPTRRELLSRDLDHLAALRAPELMHYCVSARLYFGVVAAGEELLARAAEISTPLLLLHGAADGVTSVEATRAFYDRLGAKDKTLQIYPDAVHELFNDLCRQEAIETVTTWIVARCTEASGES